MTDDSSCGVFIDADNVPFWLMQRAVRDVRSRFAEVHVRAYKDWTDPGQQGLMASLWALDVDLVQVNPHATRKNATDIAITVEVVDTHHVAPTGWVALLSNDGDFTTLVDFLRHRGVGVLGYGTVTASDQLAEACDRYVRFDPANRLPMTPLVAERCVDSVVAEVVVSCANADGWANLAVFGTAVRSGYGLTARSSGRSSWSRYFRANDEFECTTTQDGAVWVRARLRSSHTA